LSLNYNLKKMSSSRPNDRTNLLGGQRYPNGSGTSTGGGLPRRHHHTANVNDGILSDNNKSSTSSETCRKCVTTSLLFILVILILVLIVGDGKQDSGDSWLGVVEVPGTDSSGNPIFPSNDNNDDDDDDDDDEGYVANNNKPTNTDQNQQQLNNKSPLHPSSPSPPTSLSNIRPPVTTTTTTSSVAELTQFITSLRSSALTRLQGLTKQHLDRGFPQAVGRRGISWLHTNLNGLIIGAPEFELAIRQKKIWGGKINIEFKDISEQQQCPPAKANLVSIWVRLAGPEVHFRLAEPVKGECRWIARFEIHAPGLYTAYARLMHFNGGQDANDQCDVVSPTTKLSVEILHTIPRYPYQSPDTGCCPICTRFPECRYSLYGSIVDNKKWGSGDQCVLFKESTSPNALTSIAEIYNATGTPVKGARPLRYSASRQDENGGLGTIWQLGCGREEMLMRWAPCGNFGNECPPETNPKYFTGTEDIIIFEYSHRDIQVDPSKDNTKIVPLQDAEKEMDGKIGDSSLKPVCEWSNTQLRIPDYDQGRWVRSLPSRTESCGAMENFEVRNGYVVTPSFPNGIKDDAACYTRFKLQHLTLKWLRWSTEPPADYLRVWRSELSDNYTRTSPNAQLTEPVVPGPWTGRWVLSPHNTCRMAPHRNAAEIRQCVTESGMNRLKLEGKSVMQIFARYMCALLVAAFPNKKELNCDVTMEVKLNLTEGWNLLASQNKPVPKLHTVTVDNLAVPHMLPGSLRDQLPYVEKHAKTAGSYADKRIFMSSPYTVWERRSYLTPERASIFHKKFRELHLKEGWYEVDLTTISAAWAFDSTPDMDAMHYIGHPMVEIAQQVIDIICRAPLVVKK
jgi:hypothetical protein